MSEPALFTSLPIGFHRRLARLFGLALLPAFAAGCDCSPPLEPDCTLDEDCEEGEICVSGRCQPAPEEDGGFVPRDAGPYDGGPRTSNCELISDPTFRAFCESCDPFCERDTQPGPGGWMPTEENSEGVIVDEDGALTLGREETRVYSVWIANMDEGTVSKLDSRTGRELARYPSIGAADIPGVRPWNESCGWTVVQGNCPSRTSLDQNFDAYVANRAFFAQGTVTKYANREADCVDRNGNGVIDTSRDLNDDGVIDLDSAEFVGLEDECILWTAPVGEVDAVPRALAVGLAPADAEVGDVWVGHFNENEACRLDPLTGATRECIPTPEVAPYGMAADGANRIWVANHVLRSDWLGYVDVATSSFHPVTDIPMAVSAEERCLAYGITVDGAGDVFVAGTCDDPVAWRYRPSTGAWDRVEAPTGGTARGLAADDTHLWVAISHEGNHFTGPLSNQLMQFRLSDLGHVMTHTVPTGISPIGVGVSFDDSIWAICQGSNSAARLDPATGTWTEHPVGLAPYTYSDFLGFGLNVFAEPRGRYRYRVDGCPESDGVSRWIGARYVAEVPAGTSVSIFARAAESLDALAAEDWVGPFVGNPTSFEAAPGPLPLARYLEVELRLVAGDDGARPRVFSAEVIGECLPDVD